MVKFVKFVVIDGADAGFILPGVLPRAVLRLVCKGGLREDSDSVGCTLFFSNSLNILFLRKNFVFPTTRVPVLEVIDQYSRTGARRAVWGIFVGVDRIKLIQKPQK